MNSQVLFVLLMTIVTSIGTFLIRGLKGEFAVFPDWPAPVRLALATFLAVVVGAATNVETGAAFLASFLSGLVSALPTILLELLDLLKNVKTKANVAAVSAAAKMTMLLVVIMMATACSAVCPIIHAADQVCPFIIVELENGQKVQIPKGPVVQQARAIAAEKKDGVK
ncbi:MAG: hypothetical protein WC551_07735 [Patescibacteria group bacterium]